MIIKQIHEPSDDIYDDDHKSMAYIMPIIIIIITIIC